MLRMKPQQETIEPAIVTALQPYLLVSALAIGPEIYSKMFVYPKVNSMCFGMFGFINSNFDANLRRTCVTFFHIYLRMPVTKNK